MLFLLAQVISLLTNPIIIAFPLPFLLVYHETRDVGYALMWMLFSMLFIMMVGFFVLYEVKRNVFSDIDVSKREQRPLFFVFVTFISILYLLSLYVLNGPTALFIAVGGILGSAIVLGLVNQRIKASLHVASISAFFTTLSLLYGGFSLLWLAMIPVVAWSRVKIKRHTVSEAVVGCVMGIMLTLIVYFGVEMWR
ncbi:MAG: hypothetical protein HYV40_00950 [Candidatus Levybacteria bacterium]|nr:hypothetical protein [Candidatus Levybacteria bacterium]